MCGSCFCKIYDFDRYRESCAAKNNEMIAEETSYDVIDESNAAQTIVSDAEISLRDPYSSSDSSVAYISLIDDETDLESDEKNTHSATVRDDQTAFDGNASSLVEKMTEMKRGSSSIDSNERHET